MNRTLSNLSTLLIQYQRFKRTSWHWKRIRMSSWGV